MAKPLQFTILRTALAVFLLVGLLAAISSTAYGQAGAIRSNYIQLTGGGGTAMEHVGDPTGVYGLPHTSDFCCGEFRYNSGTNNKFLFFTGMPVTDPENPSGFYTPTMTQANPDANPSATAFTVGNVTDPSVTSAGIFENFVYHDLINSATGAPGADGVNDGYTGTANLNGFLIEHNAYIVLNLFDGVPDQTLFLFTITNTSAQARVFGMSWNADTQMGYGSTATGGDLASFFGPGINQFRTGEISVGFPVAIGSAAEQRYLTQPLNRMGYSSCSSAGATQPTLGALFSTGFNPYYSEIPDYIYGLHPFCDYSGLIRPGLNNVYGHNWSKADYFAVATYSEGVADSYYYGVNNGAPQGDDNSGHILRWNPRILMPGETIRIGFALGSADATCCPYPNRFSLSDQLAPSIIYADESSIVYTNSPFTSDTRVYNGSVTATLLSGKVVLKIPRAQLRPEPSMLVPGGWVPIATDDLYDYYHYALPQLPPFQTHILDPPVHLRVVPQCASEVTALYWLSLEDIEISSAPVPAQISDPIQKTLFIPRLECDTLINDNYHPLVQEGKVWSILDAEETYSPHPIQAFNYKTLQMLFSGDTIINDMPYKKMYSTIKENPIFPQDWYLHSFMREDENKKVWYKDKNQNAEEKLFYDFSLEIGDTVPNVIDYLYPVIVENITNEIMHNGEERKVFWLSSPAYIPFNIFKEYWIEGIGSIIGLIYPLHGEVVGGFWNLLCLYEDEELVFFNQNWNTCYKNSLGINDYDNQIKIYPNPAKNILFIEGIDNYDINYISLINIYGQIVRQYKSNVNQIDVSDISAGFYLLKFSINKGRGIVQKVVINR